MIRTLAILEANSITGPAKAILEFAREARASTEPRIDLSILTFVRGTEDNEFIRKVRAEGIPIDLVEEHGRFDLGVMARLRDVVQRRQPDLVWSNAVKSHFLVYATGLHKQTPWVAYHHGYTTTNFATRLYNQLDGISLRNARRVVTVCHAFERQMESCGVARDSIRVESVPIRRFDGTSLEARAFVRSRMQIDPDTTILLSVGRLSKEKGHAELIRAIAGIHQARPDLLFRLVLVGDGHEAARLRELCAALKVEELVQFAGHQSDVQDFYACADVFVLPSHSEGSPNVLLEAINANLPIVATAVGGIPEIVTNEVNALLVPAMDPEALAGAITQMLTNPALRLRLTTAARSVLDRYTPELYFQNLAQIFQQVVKGDQ